MYNSLRQFRPEIQFTVEIILRMAFRVINKNYSIIISARGLPSLLGRDISRRTRLYIIDLLLIKECWFLFHPYAGTKSYILCVISMNYIS